jgi:DNA (cytosine-5)-methyltransferase 1
MNLSFGFDELIVDSFAGGGGAATGIELAIGRPIDVAINHDAEALAMHAINHPHTVHVPEDVWTVDAERLMGKRQVGLLWASPDCKHFSKAKGGKPVKKHIRGLAWVVCKWAAKLKPRVIMLENVEEFRDWGPLKQIDGQWFPDPERKGITFQRFVTRLRNLGYKVEHRELRACDYGAPTIRKRLFLIARRDGLPIVWPAPTHGPKAGKPYRTAAECIDWSIPCPSIFERKKPLAEATMRRIARGIMRYVVNTDRPFIVNVANSKTTGRGPNAWASDEPLRTVTSSNGHALVVPHFAHITHGGREHDPLKPLPTITCAKRGELQVVAATLVQAGYGERPGQAPRALDIERPLGTIVASNKHALCTAFLAKHFGGNESPGWPMDKPISTLTAVDHHALVTSNIVKLRNNGAGQPVHEPLHTVTGGAEHFGEVRAFLLKYYSEGGQWQALEEPMHTIPTKDRVGLVMVHGEPYAIVDIGMRMLTPRELARAQGFPDTYVIDRGANGKPLSKSAQVRMIGNSVCPPVAAALVRANFTHEQKQTKRRAA